MLLFDRYGIRVYGTPLPDDINERGPRRILAEKAAVKRLMKEAFPDRPQLRIDHKESGAPFLTHTAPEGHAASAQPHWMPLPAISVTHCRVMAAIAVAPGGTKVGIDCESADRMAQLDRTAPRFLSPDQLPGWGERPATLWAWTVKEALYKAASHPGLPLAGIPLPLEIPLGHATDDSLVEIDGTVYNVVQIDISPVAGVMMLAFSDTSRQ